MIANELRPWRKDIWENRLELQFSPDSKWCIEMPLVRGHGSERRRLHLHELSGARKLDFECHSFEFAHHGSLLATIDSANTLHLWQLPSANELKQIPLAEYSGRYFQGQRLCHPEDVLPIAVARVKDEKSLTLLDVISGRTLLPAYNESSPIIFSPDGRVIAVGGDGVALFESASGGQIAKIPNGHRGSITALAFSSDGKTLTTGGADGAILAWDWAKACKLLANGPRQIESLWNDLRNADAFKAHRAIFALRAMPKEAVILLGERLKPASEDDTRRIHELIKELDHHTFSKREAAMKKLRGMGHEAMPFLLASLKGSPSVESERRIRHLLEDPKIHEFGPELLRALRALQILEMIATNEAKNLLRELAKGAPGWLLTIEAHKRAASGVAAESK